MYPIISFASGVSKEYYPPSNSDYYNKKISYKLYISPDITKVKITQFSPMENNGSKEILEEVIWDVKPNSTIWVDMTCKGDTSFQYWNGSRWVDTHTRGQTIRLSNGTCSNSGNVTLSDFNEEKNQYASDTFKGTKSPLNNPPSKDGSGGTGDSGYIGIGGDPGSGGNPGGGDPGGGDDPGGSEPGGGDDYDYPEWCDPECRILECPQWHDYMGLIEDIYNAIPPPPNWDAVADTFRDSIVPRLINDLDNLLGRAPAAPSPAPHLPPLNDGGINSKNPTMPDAPGLGNAGFNAGKIKNEAPVIQERPDPTGGFDLITNPLESLPDAPENPLPGQTDPGEWGQNKPQELDNPFPFPEDTGDPNIGNPPKPDDDANPPMPGDNVGNAPIPGGDYGPPPTTGGEVPGMKDYKPSPDAPDGSGGDIRW